MKRQILTLLLLGFSSPLWAAPDTPKAPEVDSTWPGIKMQVIEVDRIPGNRVLMLVRLWATPSAPASTLIGTPPEIPPNTKPEDRINYQADAYSLNSSTLTDEQTQVKYNSAAPVPGGPTFRPGTIMESLSAGGSCLLSVQFPLPPPPAPNPDGTIPRQTVSLLLPKAKGPITQIVIPPPPAANSHP